MDVSQYTCATTPTSAPSASMDSSLHRKAGKRDKHSAHELERHCKEVRAQLADQLKAIGDRTETQIAVLAELEDYFKRRGDAEAEHAKQLEKLAKSIMQRHKSEKSRREAWPQHSACAVWQQLVDDTREEAKSRARLAEFYAKEITASISMRCEDLARISKRCRDIGLHSHEEISRVLSELHSDLKNYQTKFAIDSDVERKLRAAQEQLRKYEDSNKGKPSSSKHNALLKRVARRQAKYDAVHAECTKYRNEYMLSVRAANAALHRFFADDSSYLVDCLDLGMEFWLRCTLDSLIDARKALAQREMEALGELGTLRSALDAKADKQRFFEANHATFMLPKSFEFRPQVGDLISCVLAERSLVQDLLGRQRQLTTKLTNLQDENDKVWRNLEATERNLFALFREQTDDAAKWRSDLLLTYQTYLNEFEQFLIKGNLLERLKSRCYTIGNALAHQGIRLENGFEPNGELERKKTRRIGHYPDRPRPKLFGGSLEEYVEASDEAIPLIVCSSIAFLARYALRHQGLFRVSGSQSEINRFKEAFENGEDPLSGLHDASEANSVAGVLKLYLRELREPLFPMYLFEQFTDCAKSENADEFVERAKKLLTSLPTSSLLLLRVLFGFLDHLCEFASENMMQPHNLAICFGPTLLPIPEGKDQVFYHNFVNTFVRGLIVHHERVFPTREELPGPVYDRYAYELHNIDYVDDIGGFACLLDSLHALRDDGMTSGDEEVLLDETSEDAPAPIYLNGVSNSSALNSTATTPAPSAENTSIRDLAFRDVFNELSLALKEARPNSILQRASSPNDLSFPSSSRSSARSAAIDFQPLELPSMSPRPTTRVPVVSLRDQLSHAATTNGSSHNGNKVFPGDLDSAVTRTSIRLQKLSMLDSTDSLPSVEKSPTSKPSTPMGSITRPDAHCGLQPSSSSSSGSQAFLPISSSRPFNRADSPGFSELERAIEAAQRL